MATFDPSVYNLHLKRATTAGQAVEPADSRTDVPVCIRLHTGQGPDTSSLKI